MPDSVSSLLVRLDAQLRAIEGRCELSLIGGNEEAATYFQKVLEATQAFRERLAKMGEDAKPDEDRAKRDRP